MAIKDTQGETGAGTHLNLITMQKYIKQHFARPRGNWNIKCIPEDT